MNRRLPFVYLYTFVMLLQIYVLNQIMISVLFMPMVYSVLIMLMPVHSDQMRMLMVGLAVGLSGDFLLGMGGISTITILFMSFIRIWIVNLTIGREASIIGGVPSYRRFGVWRYILYSTIFVTLTNAIFFTLESLGSIEWRALLIRIGVSTVGSLIFMLPITHLFSNYIWGAKRQ